MAAPPNLCRLCITTSNDNFKSLYDEYGQANGLFEMTYEYFHPKIVDLDKAKHLTAICLECFRHIQDFHSFQTSVTVAQLKLTEEDKTIYTITEVIETPRRESLTQSMAIEVEGEELIGLTPEYDAKKDCPQIMKEEFIALPDKQLEDSSPSTSTNNCQIIDSLSIGGGANEEDDSRATFEIMDIETSSTYTTDDVISSSHMAVRNPSLNENRSSDGINDTLDYLLAKWIPIIKCFKCEKTFSKWPLLMIHFKLLHPNEQFHYVCCSRQFNRIQIKDHLRLHSDPDAFKCSICDRRYAYSSSLASHYSEQHPECAKFQCNKCERRCASNQGLSSHYRKMHSSTQDDAPDLEMHHTPPPTPNTDNTTTKVRLSKPDPILRPTNNNDASSQGVRRSRSSDTIDNQKYQIKYETIENLLAKYIPNIECFKCQKSFPSWSVLKEHFKRQHPNEIFHYMCCSRKFNRFQIKDHLCLHGDYDAFKCSKCGTRYKSNNSLALHNTVKHSESLKFPCDMCDKRYTTANTLALHKIKVHTTDSQYLPDLEIHRSPQTTSEDHHETTISLSMQEPVFHNADEEEDRKDNISLPPLDIMDVDTGSSFSSDDEIPLAQIDDRNPSGSNSLNSDAVGTQKSSDDQPQKFHESLKTLLDKWIPDIKCFKCSKTFSSWSLSKRHFKLTHPNEKFYYKCCSRKLSRDAIKDHLRLHGDPNAFKCLICDKIFKTSQWLSAHNALAHTESLKIPCDKCGRRFRSNIGLRNHQSKIHHSNRQDHVKVQFLADGRTAYNCQLCGETKYTLLEFRQHKSRVHGWTSYKVVCTICGHTCLSDRTFREHMASHENKKIYKCSFCPAKYGTVNTMKTHRQSRHPLESGKIFYTYIGESESESNESPKSVKSTSASVTEKADCGKGNPHITVMSIAKLQDSKATIQMDNKTMTRVKKEDVNTDCETSCDGETEQNYSTSSLESTKNDDSREECGPTTSMAATADQQMDDNKAKKSVKRSRFDQGRKKAE